MNENTQQFTKKERREMRRQERMSESASMRRKNTVRRLGIWGGVFLGLGLLLYGLVQLGSGSQNAAQGQLAVAVSNSDWAKGNQDSQIVLVEYGDFQCPACGAYFPLVEQLIREHGDKFKFVYRHFPLERIHPNAEPASRASEAAGLQGKFWEMYALIYENQSSWSNLTRNSADAKFFEYARELGLDENKFKSDFESEGVKDKVKDQFDGGASSGITSTPTFFLNGNKISNPQSYEQFVQLISGPVEVSEPIIGTIQPTP